MQRFSVSGMSCAACVSRVEKAVSGVKGVSSCSVSLLTNSMNVDGVADPQKIISAVEKAGYGASVVGEKNSAEKQGVSFRAHSFESDETLVLIKRLSFSALALLLLMYVSMAHYMWNAPLPKWFDGNYVAIGLLQMILASVILFINKKFFVNGFRSVLHGSPNMDTLVALGSGVSFLYSTVVLFNMTDAIMNGDENRVASCMHNLYFEGSATIVTLITVGKLLESISKGRTTNALKALMNLAPKNALLVREGKEISVPIEEVKIGDIFIVRPGMSVPVDGVVVEGESAINEAAVTGESIPVDKIVGSEVISATMNMNGYIKCRATRVGEDTTLSKIIQLVSDAAATKAPIAKIADTVSGVFVPIVIAISIITLAVWLVVGASFSFALSRAIAVLVISCPCALGLATPVAIMVGNGVAAKNGILFKTSASLEALGKISVVALDKTGTLTKGEMQVTDSITVHGLSELEFFKIAASLEAKSEHPIAKAVIKKYASLMGASSQDDLHSFEHTPLSFFEAENFSVQPGNGLSAVIDGKEVVGGSVKYIKSLLKTEENAISDETLFSAAETFSSLGKTPLMFAQNGTLLGLVALSDVLKDDSVSAVQQMKNMNLCTVMITGDNEKTANAIGKTAGVDKIIAGVLPNEKAEAVSQLKKGGAICMVGDGINDAPALTVADVGVAIGAGTDVALDAADVVLMKGSLLDVVAAIRLSRRVILNIKENLFWAFFYNVIGIPLAAGCYYHSFGWSLNPMFAAAAMSLSSFFVVSNALRLNLFAIHKEGRMKIHIRQIRRKKMTEKTIKVEGMMCANCEHHVKDALEKIKGVDEATASHEKGEVLLKMSKNVDDKRIAKAVEEAGYTFIG